MDALARFAESFIGLFHEGGAVFLSLAGGILPTLIVLITAVNALIRIIGQDRVDRIAQFAAKNIFLRYTVMPVAAVFFLTNPMAYTMGKFLPEKHKPAFYDAAVSFVHPILGLFPHANPAEIFVYMGIAVGVSDLGLPLGPLAVRYFIVGVIVIFIRGVVTEWISARMFRQRDLAQSEEVASL